MKFLSKFTFIVLALGCIVAFSSCEKDEDEPEIICYQCAAYEDTVSMQTIPEVNYCEGDAGGASGEYTLEEIESLVAVINGIVPGTCVKQ